MAFDFKTATPDSTLPTTGFLFGADSQSATDPSIYTTQALATTLLGSSTLSGQTVTASTPVVNLTQTWNNVAVTFTGWRLNITDTTSAAASLLFELQLGGASRFSVSKAGVASFVNGTIAAPSVRIGSAQTGLAVDPATSNQLSIVHAGAEHMRIGFSTVVTQGILCASASPVNFVLGSSSVSTNPALVKSGTIAQVRLGDNSAYTALEASTLRTATAYTVATLPAAGQAGRRAYVTDATAPTFLGTLTGGGSIVCPVFDNGTAWVSG